MKKHLIAFGISLLLTVGVFFVYQSNKEPIKKALTFGAFSDPFLSLQLATSPSNGYILSTDGTNNSWVANSGGGSGTVSTSTNEIAGRIPYWTSNSGTPALLGQVATTTASCSGDASCTPFTIIGSTPIDITATAGAGSIDGVGVAQTLTSWVDTNTVTATGTAHALYASAFVSTTTKLNIFPYATSTYHSFTTASSTNYLGAGLQTCNASTGKLTWASGQFSCATDNTASSTLLGDTNTWSGTNNFGVVTGISLDEIENPAADKTFTMGANNLAFNFTTPSSGLELNATGAFNDHVLHVHQSVGNPGAGTQLLHLHAEDPDVMGLVIAHDSASTSPAIQVVSGTTDLTGGLLTTKYSTSTTYASFATASTTNLNIGGDAFTDLTGTGLAVSGGVLNTSAIPNASLSNSTISGVALGGTLFALTNDTTLNGSSYTGTSAISDWGLNLGNANTWTVNQTFNYSSSTIYSSFETASTSALVASNSVNLFGGGAKTTANALCIQLTGSSALCDGSDDGAGGGGSDPFTHPLLGLSATTSQMLIGTSTASNYQLTIASSTAPQLSLSAGAGLAQWAFRNAGGNLYFSTTTIAGTATTSISALEISGSGFGTTTVRGLNISGQATSTSNVGWNITNGCYAIAGTCVGGGTGTFTNTLANGGTATTTFYNGGIIFASSTGSGLLSQSSDPKNFFWDETNKRLGLGTSTPFAKLSVNSEAGEPAFVVGSSTATSLIVTANGNVGIGTASPNYKLDVNGGTGNTIYGYSSTGNGVTGESIGGAYGNAIAGNTDFGFAGFFNQTGNIWSLATSPAVYVLRNNILNGFDQTGPVLKIESSVADTGNLLQVIKQSSTKFVIDSTGNVGIGTTTPFALLQLSSTTASATFKPQLALSDYSASADLKHWTLSSQGGNFYIASATDLYATTTGISAVTIKGTTGYTGIATSAPATALDVNGTITQLTVKSCTLGLTTDALGSITGCVVSDERMKTDIEDINYDPSLIGKLKPVFYKWKDPKKDTQLHAGFVAQDVQKVFPEAVVSAGKDTLGVDSNAILALVVKELQNLKQGTAQAQRTAEENWQNILIGLLILGFIYQQIKINKLKK